MQDERPSDAQDCDFSATAQFGDCDDQEEEPDHHFGRRRRWAFASYSLYAWRPQFAAIDTIPNTDLPANATARAAAYDAADPVPALRSYALLPSGHPAYLSPSPEQLSAGAPDSAAVSMTFELDAERSRRQTNSFSFQDLQEGEVRPTDRVHYDQLAPLPS